MLPQIIGITGKKFSGKDTLGNYLIKKHNYKRFAFADALKEACRAIFNFDDEQLYGNKKEEIDEFWNVTPRTIFQFVGTDLFRNQISTVVPNIGSNIWTEVLKKKILNEIVIDPNVKIIITDVRFENEIALIKELNGSCVRLKRNDIEYTDTHCSEQYIDNFKVDLDILNNGTKDELYIKFEKNINLCV